MSGVAHVVRRGRADDPHTLAVLALADAMSGRHRSAMFAMEHAYELEGVQPLEQLPADAATLVLYHQRGAAPALVSRLVEHRGPLTVAVGGVTSGVTSGVTGAASADPLALRDLRALAAAGATALAASDAAADRLAAVGFARVVTVPPVVAVRNRLVAVGAFEPTSHHLDVTLKGPLVLTVDDVVTAANAARVVQAHHVLRTYLSSDAHLAVGIEQTPDTSQAAVRVLYREIWGLRLTDAWAQRLQGRGECAALARRAAVFVTAAPAAGDVRQCLAVMAEGVPVVAPAAAEARDVLGDGALLLPSDAGAALVAEAVAELLDDQSRRSSLAAAASRVVARFDPVVVAPVWREALAS